MKTNKIILILISLSCLFAFAAQASDAQFNAETQQKLQRAQARQFKVAE
jgi:hypothetical protein